ncbi:DUF4194 domain-containing protein [Luteimonas sp. MHLX1A]|uniref:DUF4194 domain-containing protein n=1 Tax=Alterluteimonas muca TaxID=2878684 RepID=UPI001E4BDE7D|nr:DUF4194 domain-containing protein [Luteimonas sp. MHLX1A]MCD9046857.1 DUF4194 domain-containing protein [Luteimonas sp. MHLX1A]
MSALQQLAKLDHLRDLFATLNRGRHVNRLQDGAWWNELDREQDTYRSLFALLGYQLEIDPRGFAWFHTEEPAANMANKTRKLALLMLALFERKADQGMSLTRFHEWLIDNALLEEVQKESQAMLEAEGLASSDALVATMGSAVSYGFAAQDGPGRWRLLPAAWRYLDCFEALAAEDEAAASVLEDDAP